MLSLHEQFIFYDFKIVRRQFFNIVKLCDVLLWSIKKQHYTWFLLNVKKRFLRCTSFQKPQKLKKKYIVIIQIPEWFRYKSIFSFFLMKILWLISANWCLKKYCLWTRFLTKFSEFDLGLRVHHFISETALYKSGDQWQDISSRLTH